MNYFYCNGEFQGYHKNTGGVRVSSSSNESSKSARTDNSNKNRCGEKVRVYDTVLRGSALGTTTEEYKKFLESKNIYIVRINDYNDTALLGNGSAELWFYTSQFFTL